MHTGNTFKPQTTPEGNHFFPAEGKPCGRVMLCHGLNHDPSSWHDMVSLLTSSGLHVYRLAVTGHRGNGFEEMSHVSGEGWLQDFYVGYSELMTLTPELPCYLVGFSMGSLIALTAQLKRGMRLFEKQVLLAPAVSVHLYTRLVLPVSLFVKALPSRSTQYYVANKEGTTSEAYRAFFQIEKMFRRYRDLELINIPTSVLMRRSDELVDYQGIKKLMKKKDLNQWQMIQLKDHVPLSKKVARFQHMIVDHDSAGDEGWQRILKEIRRRFVPGGRPWPELH